MSLGKCQGYEFPCGDPAEWTVEATDVRDEWIACENCARDALLDESVCIDATGYRLEVA